MFNVENESGEGGVEPPLTSQHPYYIRWLNIIYPILCIISAFCAYVIEDANHACATSH